MLLPPREVCPRRGFDCGAAAADDKFQQSPFAVGLIDHVCPQRVVAPRARRLDALMLSAPAAMDNASLDGFAESAECFGALFLAVSVSEFKLNHVIEPDFRAESRQCA